ncbi:MAG: DUF4625 domain-containing protein [Candidatus Cryptobacteroides sp.]
MYFNKSIFFAFLSLALLFSCKKGGESVKDLEKPHIIVSEESSPKNCNVFYKGAVLPVKFVFTDNLELGNYNIEIHNNFDHHTHSTEAEDCKLDPIKQPVNPWIFNQDYSIPAGKTAFDVELEIPVPVGIDEGDYHFMIRLTDKSGWQQLRSFSIKVKTP